ncbi:MAG: DnaJ domain-containing protein [Rhodocyclaceae bacterium]|nr:DnaJ domain-containing protein [Rhodocyclaceae bacterium]
MSERLFDPHGILEVAEDADLATIRRAFRRLAMRWHPDRNADPAATERFREIRAAFDWLTGDPDVAEVDNGGEADAEPTAGDRHETLDLSLVEAMLGCDKPFVIRRQRHCEACDGEGSVALSHTRLCDFCHGSGKVRTAHGLEKCHICSGRGYVQRATCDSCAGSGEVVADKTVAIHVGAGMLPGEVLRLKGLGHELANGSAGTLFLTIRLVDDGLFRLDGRDILSSQPVSMLRLMAGGRVSIAAPLGPVLIDLDPDQIAGRELRLAGKGYPGRGGSLDDAGDLVVTLEPCLPEQLDEPQRRGLGRLEDQLQRDRATHFPELDAWWQAYLASRP